MLGRALDERLSSVGLTPTAFSALFHLARSPALSAAALARAILVTPQSVGPVLDGLAAVGLVVRERGGPRGAIRTTVTASGAQRLAAAQRVVRRLDDELSARLPGVDRHQLAAALHLAAEGGFADDAATSDPVS